MKRKRDLLWIIVIPVTVLLVLAGCIGIIRSNLDGTQNTKPAGDDSADITSDIPEPAASNRADWSNGEYYSGVYYQNAEAFLVKLKESGWKNYDGKELCTEVSDKSTELTLTDGARLLQLIININDKRNSSSNSILMHLDEGVSGTFILNRKDAISKTGARSVIQPVVDAMVKSNDIPADKRSITGLIELYIDDTYEKMKLQAFAAFSDGWVIGNFLVCNGTAMYVLDDLQETCVADPDRDGRYELVSLFGFGSGIYRVIVSAYEYGSWRLSSSMGKYIYREYYNSFIPDNGYAELHIKKTDDLNVKLIGKDTEYGNLITEGSFLVLDDMENFPFKQWRNVYDQSKLPSIEKSIPQTTPDIIISIDGRSLDYITEVIKWNGKEKDDESYNSVKIFDQIIKKGEFIPTYVVGGIEERSHSVELNFGEYIPDTITVEDILLNDNGSIRYNSRTIVDRPVEILDDSRASFGLMQHAAYFLSSNSEDYEKDWYRMFRINCTWGDNKAVYSFIINTGSKESVTEIDKEDFLVCDGAYSSVYSSWGMNLYINDTSEVLPKDYIIEWQVNGGKIKTWKEKNRMPVSISDVHNGFPMTFSGDKNQGSVIWSPASFEDGDKAVITVYIYRNAKDKSPVARSKAVLICKNGMWSGEGRQ